MKNIFIFLSLITLKCYSQISQEEIQKGDTLIKISQDLNLNIYSKSKRVKGQDLEFIKTYILNSNILIEEGQYEFYKNWKGLRKIYSNEGKIIREINYENNTETFFNNYSKPFKEYFNFIKIKTENNLRKKFGKSFYDNFLILNPNNSVFFGKTTSDYWFEIPEEKPNYFQMTYDIKWQNNRVPFLYFSLDSLGNYAGQKFLTKINKINNYNQKPLLSKKNIEKIALKNGLTENDKPLEYKFILTQNIKTELQLIVYGKPFETVTDGEKTKASYVLITIDPFTGKFLKKEKKSFESD
jgi:hypothetical protein